ncbi:MAG: queuosine salvage family protein [Patescibacteria group bacterium]
MAYTDTLNPFSRELLVSWERMPHEYVSINVDAFIRTARADSRERKFTLPVGSEPGLEPADHGAFVTYLFWESVVNFCFSHPYVRRVFTVRGRNGKRWSGSSALYVCFYRRFGGQPIFADDIFPIVDSLQKTKRFFAGEHYIPLAGERRELLLEAAAVVKDRFDGDPRHIVEAGHHRAFGGQDRLGIVEMLVNYFPKAFGTDAATVTIGDEKRRLHFMKRAQLFVMLYHRHAVASGGALHPLSDIGALGPILDYELPRGYRADGVLQYEPELEHLIASREPIPSKSPMEIELRLATAWAFAHELNIVNDIREVSGEPPIGVPELDYTRWSYSQSVALNHHICLTTDY